ncbi:MAG TPA: helix-turn-helix transcriptional regulator [Steroidobacteraceae bacterium]|nr:helix-turn-helix transcriptional regulator [Steroidobacteraceae bacterium]
MDLIIAAPDEATRALLRERLSAAGWFGGAHVGTVERPAQLIEQLAVQEDAAPPTRAGTLVVTAQGSPDRQEFMNQEFMGMALARGVPVLVWPLQQRARTVPPASAQMRRLSAREREILSLVAAGISNKGIARSLRVSPNTVKFHLAALFTKLAVGTRAEAIAAAARIGELSL